MTRARTLLVTLIAVLLLAAPASAHPAFTIPVEAPDRRIDCVLTSPEIGARHAEVIAGDASDHLPLVVGLAIPKAAR